MLYHKFLSRLRANGFGPAQIPAEIYIVEVPNCKMDHARADVEWLLVEKQEHAVRNAAGDVTQAKLSMQYWSLNDDMSDSDKPDGEFSAFYDGEHNGVSLSSHSLWQGGYILVEPARLCGLGLGTYFMNKVVMWGKQWPDAQVRQIELPKGQSEDKPAQQLRLHFYGRFGIKFDFPDSTPTDGIARPMRARELTVAPGASEAITEHSAVEFLRELVSERRRSAWEVDSLSRNLKREQLTLNNAYRRPIAWAFMRLVVDEPARTLSMVVIGCAIGLGIYRILY